MLKQSLQMRFGRYLSHRRIMSFISSRIWIMLPEGWRTESVSPALGCQRTGARTRRGLWSLGESVRWRKATGGLCCAKVCSNGWMDCPVSPETDKPRYRIEWLGEQVLRARMNRGGRSMELSELLFHHDKLFGFL